MFAEAVAEARRARELFDGSSQPIAFEGYALAKSGKQAEARAVLEQLLKLSTERHVTPYHIALVYNGLNERDKTRCRLSGVSLNDQPKNRIVYSNRYKIKIEKIPPPALIHQDLFLPRF